MTRRHSAIRPGSLLGLVLLGLAVAGCSTWRCRGFVSRLERPVAAPRGSYVIDSLEFRKLRPGNEQDEETHPALMQLSQRDAFVGTSYVEDVARAAGLTNTSPKAVKVKISIVPVEERSWGASTIWWPMVCTLGIYPAHAVDEISFDVIVRFVADLPDRPDLSPWDYAGADMAVLRTDLQYGLSRMDMDAPPPAPSSVAELRDDGTVGTGRHLRPQRLREAFVQTVAAAVLDEIAVREKSERIQVSQSATEFGPIDFPEYDKFERENTPGWGKGPVGPGEALESIEEEYLKRVWNYPRDEFERKMKRSVEKGVLTKAQWDVYLRKHYGELKAERK